jgi:hypothetical protein
MSLVSPESLVSLPLFPVMAHEFPDFDQSTLPSPLPATFHDASYRNDASPCLIDYDLGAAIWIADESMIGDEDQPSTFYALATYDDQDGHLATLAESDNWSDILHAALGTAFAKRLKAELTPGQWLDMRAKNAANGDSLVCHSHDYLDANEVMHEAFQALFPGMFAGEEEADSLWNGAWEYAMTRWLKAGTDDDHLDYQPSPEPDADPGRTEGLEQLRVAMLQPGAVPSDPFAAILDSMADLYRRWTSEQGLPEVDADELILSDITADQRRWVSDFIIGWEAVQARADDTHANPGVRA